MKELSAVPSGLGLFFIIFPPINRWAINERPSRDRKTIEIFVLEKCKNFHPKFSTMRQSRATNRPQRSTTRPRPDTNRPRPNTKTPQASTIAPRPNTTRPQPTTKTPRPTTIRPQTSTKTPQLSTKPPQIFISTAFLSNCRRKKATGE